MSSGITVSDEVVQAHKELKMGKKYKYFVCKISDDLKNVVVSDKVTESTHEEFLGQLPPDEPRYVIYDFHYENKEGAKRDEVIFIAWCPDNTKVKKRMLHATTKDAIKKKLDVGKSYQATEISDITEEVIKEDLQKKP